MKRVALGLMIVGLLATSQPGMAQTPTAAQVTRLPVDNSADDFLAFWDATRDLPTPERVAAFKRDVAPLFPEFYGIERFNGRMTEHQQDKRIADAIEGFPQVREVYSVKVAAFEASLARNFEPFLAAFPDFHAEIEVNLIHSLGEMNGAVRTFDGRTHLIFGADVMAWANAGADDSAFFHHELFHIHHRATFGSCSEIWCNVWIEGLAVHASEQLNPGATPDELLLTFPADLMAQTDARIGLSWLQLNTVLASTNRNDIAGLTDLRTGAADLPPRRGYYLGYLIAKRLGETLDLQTLTTMSAEQVRPLVFAAVAQFVAENPVPAEQ